MSVKYQPGIVESIIDHIASGLYSLKDICKYHNISESTYYLWLENQKEFKKAVEAAKKRQVVNIDMLATKGMVKLLKGGYFEETMEEFEVPPAPTKYDFLDDDDELNQVIQPEEPKPVLKRRIVSKKYIMPDRQTVIFVKRNLDKANYPENKQLTFDNKQPIPVAFVPPAGLTIDFPDNTDDPTLTRTIKKDADGTTDTNA